MAEHALGPVWQIPPGEGRRFLVAGLAIAIFRTRGGALFATQANCPHRGGPLADGLTDGRTVICPLHDRIFSLATGEGLGNECSLAVYGVRAGADGGIYLDSAGGPASRPPPGGEATPRTPAFFEGSDASSGNRGGAPPLGA